MKFVWPSSQLYRRIKYPLASFLLRLPIIRPTASNKKPKTKTKQRNKQKRYIFILWFVGFHYEGERISGPSLLLDLVPRSLLFPSRWSIPWERGCSTARKSSFSTGFIVTIPLFFLNAGEYIIWQNSFVADSGAHKYALLWITGFNC